MIFWAELLILIEYRVEVLELNQSPDKNMDRNPAGDFQVVHTQLQLMIYLTKSFVNVDSLV